MKATCWKTKFDGHLTPGNRADWANEIHPNKSGWKKQSTVWANELLSKLI